MKNRQVWMLAVLLATYSIASHAQSMTMMAPMSMPVAPVTFDALYVVNGGDGINGSISVINTATNKVERTIGLMNAMWPHHIYQSADRSKLLVAVPGMDLSMGHGTGGQGMMGAVMLLDAKTGATLHSTLLPMMNHNAIFSPNQKEVWTSQMMMSGSILVLDAGTLKTLSTIAVGAMPAELTFSPSGRTAWVANGMSDSVSVIDTSSKRVVRSVSVGSDPVVPSQALNGHIYVDNEAGQSVSVIDGRFGHVDFTYNLGFTPGYAKLGPDGHLWVTDPEGSRVVLYSADRDVKLHEIRAGAGAHAIAFSADGRTAYITNQMANTVSVINVFGRALEATVPVGMSPNGLVFRAQTR